MKINTDMPNPMTSATLYELRQQLYELTGVDKTYLRTDEKHGINERIAKLESILANAQEIDCKLVADAEGRCVFGSTVGVRELETGETFCYKIVGDYESEVRWQPSSITISSPLARGLIGKCAGDLVIIHTLGGPRSLELLDVKYE